MKKLTVLLVLLSSLFTVHYSLFTRIAYAHCPLCVAGAGVGLTLTRWVGIDDSISGVWLGALLGAIAFWSESVVKDRELKIRLRPLIYVGISAITIWTFYKFNLIVTHGEIFGLHKLTFGMIAGGILFYLVDLVDDLVIKKGGKVFFPYQRIIVSLGSMFVLSLVIFYLINYVI